MSLDASMLFSLELEEVLPFLLPILPAVVPCEDKSIVTDTKPFPQPACISSVAKWRSPWSPCIFSSPFLFIEKLGQCNLPMGIHFGIPVFMLAFWSRLLLQMSCVHSKLVASGCVLVVLSYALSLQSCDQLDVMKSA